MTHLTGQKLLVDASSRLSAKDASVRPVGRCAWQKPFDPGAVGVGGTQVQQVHQVPVNSQLIASMGKEGEGLKTPCSLEKNEIRGGAVEERLCLVALVLVCYPLLM